MKSTLGYPATEHGEKRQGILHHIGCMTYFATNVVYSFLSFFFAMFNTNTLIFTQLLTSRQVTQGQECIQFIRIIQILRVLNFVKYQTLIPAKLVTLR